MKSFFGAIKYVHFVGIKGVGMTALAHVLKSHGYTISGSDISEHFATDAILRKLNIRVMEGFNPLNIPPRTELIIHSAAYTRENNVELREAHKMKIPFLTYPQALGKISAAFTSIGVAGTHGKTTTTAMLGTVLTALGLDPTIIVGSGMIDLDRYNARVGQGAVLVAETCEYRRHFLEFSPTGIIVTNIEAEHLDYFTDLSDVTDAFRTYIQKLPSGGIVALNMDNPASRELHSNLPQQSLQIVSYGLQADAEWIARDITVEGGITTFTVHHFEDPTMRVSLQVPGIHNVYNALSVIAFTCRLLQQDQTANLPQALSVIQESLAGFRGTVRRFELKGTTRGVIIYDDYAHHPTEIRATLQAARSLYPQNRIVAVFMPHTYSRTKALINEFAESFIDADEVIINEIYSSARETDTLGITGQTLANAIQPHRPNTSFIPTIPETIAYLKKTMQEGDVIITLGAGNNWHIGDMLLKDDAQSGNSGTSKLRLIEN